MCSVFRDLIPSNVSRRSSVVEQLIRNQQVGGSIPLAGSSQYPIGQAFKVIGPRDSVFYFFPSAGWEFDLEE